MRCVRVHTGAAYTRVECQFLNESIYDKIVDLAQGDKSVTGEHSPYNNMGKMGKKLAKRPIIAFFHLNGQILIKKIYIFLPILYI